MKTFTKCKCGKVVRTRLLSQHKCADIDTLAKKMIEESK